MKVLAIDPGCDESAWVLYENGEVLQFGKETNAELLLRIRMGVPVPHHLAIEMVASYGMPVGVTVFETVLWIGRFIQQFELTNGAGKVTKVYRKDVKIHLCGSMKAKDGNIRQALVDRFGPPGTKKTPGITYGISKDVWSALAVAVTFSDRLT